MPVPGAPQMPLLEHSRVSLLPVRDSVIVTLPEPGKSAVSSSAVISGKSPNTESNCTVMAARALVGARARPASPHSRPLAPRTVSIAHRAASPADSHVAHTGQLLQVPLQLSERVVERDRGSRLLPEGDGERPRRSVARQCLLLGDAGSVGVVARGAVSQAAVIARERGHVAAVAAGEGESGGVAHAALDPVGCAGR